MKLDERDRRRYRAEICKPLALKHDEHFRQACLAPAIAAGMLEMTPPEKPNSRMQRYRLTPRGIEWLQRHTR